MSNIIRNIFTENVVLPLVVSDDEYELKKQKFSAYNMKSRANKKLLLTEFDYDGVILTDLTVAMRKFTKGFYVFHRHEDIGSGKLFIADTRYPYLKETMVEIKYKRDSDGEYGSLKKKIKLLSDTLNKHFHEKRIYVISNDPEFFTEAFFIKHKFITSFQLKKLEFFLKYSINRRRLLAFFAILIFALFTAYHANEKYIIEQGIYEIKEYQKQQIKTKQIIGTVRKKMREVGNEIEKYKRTMNKEVYRD